MWEPIVAGERATRVWSAVGDIADALAEQSDPAADLAVFWTYLASERDDAATAERARTAVERFVAELERGYDRPALFEGLAGAGWAAAHLASDAHELLDAIDDRLLALLEPGRWHGDLDLISGVAGLGVYFLERGNALGLERAVAQLAAAAERDEHGVTWHTPAERLAAIDRPRWPAGTYDCGVAHGVAGIAGVLARIAARDDAPLAGAAAAPLAADAARWLLAQRHAGQFPALLHGAQRDPARTGWCYGAPGTALALGRPDLADWLAEPPDAIAVDGDGLCHGAACLMHAANRTAIATGRAEHRATAIAWVDRVLAARRPGEALGGYGYAATGQRAAAILSGAAGVGLALLATASALEPAWDRVLLCDPFAAR